MDLKNQLENLFPDHNFKDSKDNTKNSYNQHDPVICKYEKRKGKPITIIEGFTSIIETDKKEIAKRLKTMLSVGGTVKGGKIIIPLPLLLLMKPYVYQQYSIQLLHNVIHTG